MCLTLIYEIHNYCEKKVCPPCMQAWIEAKREKVKEYRDTIDEKELEIEEMQKEIQDKQSDIQSKKEEIEEMENVVIDLRTQVDYLEEDLNEYRSPKRHRVE